MRQRAIGLQAISCYRAYSNENNGLGIQFGYCRIRIQCLKRGRILAKGSFFIMIMHGPAPRPGCIDHMNHMISIERAGHQPVQAMCTHTHMHIYMYARLCMLGYAELIRC